MEQSKNIDTLETYHISPQLFDLNQKIDLNLVTLLSFQLLEFSS